MFKETNSFKKIQTSEIRSGTYGELRTYQSSREMFEQGWDATDVFLIHTGIVKLCCNAPDGTQIIVALRCPGDLIGAASVIAKLPYSTTAVSLGRVELERIPASHFNDLLTTDPHFSMLVHKFSSKELLGQIDRLTEMACGRAHIRLKRVLKGLMDIPSQFGRKKNCRVLPLKRTELAQLVGVSPEHLTRTLRALEEEGAVRIKGQWIEMAMRDELIES